MNIPMNKSSYSTILAWSLIISMIFGLVVYFGFYRQATHIASNLPYSVSTHHIKHNRFTILQVSPKNMGIAFADQTQQPLEYVDKVLEYYKNKEVSIVGLMNGGMYHASGQPVGLLIQNGIKMGSLNTAQGVGNFYMQPNGVFMIRGEHAEVVTTDTYQNLTNLSDVQLATQSGPMLMVDGIINPQFNPLSTSKHVRNGICAEANKTYWIISQEVVNFYEFAHAFKTLTPCRHALYLDGVVSTLWMKDAPNEYPQKRKLGPMLYVFESLKSNTAIER